MTRPPLSPLPALLLLALSIPAAAQLAPAPAAGDHGSIEVVPPVVDFGDLYAGEDATMEVSLTNRGAADWPVRQVRPSCGCTVASVFAPDGTRVPESSRDGMPITTVKPGETMKVEVVFSTHNQQGPVEKKLFVYGLSSEDASVELKLVARVNRVLLVTPTYLQLGSIGKREPIEREVLIEARDIGPWKISGFGSMYEEIPLPEFVKLQLLDEEGDSRRVKVRLQGDRPVGHFSAQVRVAIDHPRLSETSFTVIGVVQPDISFESGHKTFPEALVFDQMVEGSKVTRSLRVTNRDPSVPYLLESAEVRGPKPEFFAVTVHELERGVLYQVDLTADSAIGMPFFRGALVLRASHPEMPEKSIQFHGWVKQKAD